MNVHLLKVLNSKVILHSYDEVVLYYWFLPMEKNICAECQTLTYNCSKRLHKLTLHLFWGRTILTNIVIVNQICITQYFHLRSIIIMHNSEHIRYFSPNVVLWAANRLKEWIMSLSLLTIIITSCFDIFLP